MVPIVIQRPLSESNDGILQCTTFNNANRLNALVTAEPDWRAQIVPRGLKFTIDNIKKANIFHSLEISGLIFFYYWTNMYIKHIYNSGRERVPKIEFIYGSILFQTMITNYKYLNEVERLFYRSLSYL